MKTDEISTQEWGDWSAIYTTPRLTPARMNDRGVANLMAQLLRDVRTDYINACIAAFAARESGIAEAIVRTQEGVDDAGEFYRSDIFLTVSPLSVREYTQKLEAEAAEEAKARASGRRYKDPLRQERYEKRLCVNCGAKLPNGFTKVCCQACNDRANLSRREKSREKWKAWKESRS